MAQVRRYEQKLAMGRQFEEGVANLTSHLKTDKMLAENFRSDPACLGAPRARRSRGRRAAS